ncbi:MAG: tol-pal system protein YbgF [Pseudomonadota bacterium]
MKKYVVLFGLLAASIMPAQALEPNAPVIKVQSNNADYRVSLLEEQIRQLTGRIEDLNFQLLEMQERIRRMQEDNDFRLQQLEDERGNLNSNSETETVDSDGFIRLGKPEPSDQQAVTAGTDGNQQSSGRTIDGVEIYDGEASQGQDLSGTLGSIQFDENGNIIDTQLGKPLDLTATLGNSVNSDLPQDADGLFQHGYDLLQAGRYEDAEEALTTFSNSYTTHPRLPEARFWLGESYLGRGQFREAAEVYLETHKRWPNGKFGPQSLMKLGVSVAGLNQRELACATFAEVLEKYPNASRAIRRNIAFEQRAARCALN